MNKYIKDFLQSSKGILTIFVLIIVFFTWLYVSYTSPKNVQYNYSGLKFQAGNLQSAEPVNIEIKGKFAKELFGSFGEFNGTIKMGETTFVDRKIMFNKYKMGGFISSEDQFGAIFIDDIFKKLTIELHESNGKGGSSWSVKNGWMISAPCSDRTKAVEIANELILKQQKGLIIK